MAIIAARAPYYIEQNTITLTVKTRVWDSNATEPTVWQNTLVKGSYTGSAADLRMDISPYIKSYFTMTPPEAPANLGVVSDGEWLNVKISVNDVEETHTAVYGYTSPVDESYYDHWQCVKRVHVETDSFVSLPPGIYGVNYATDDGQTVLENTTSATLPNRAIVDHPQIDLSTANTLTISTALYDYKYEIVCPFMDGTIMFVNATGQWETFDVNGRQDFTYSKEATEYIPFSVGESRTSSTNGGYNIVANTGWVDYEFHRVMEEMLMSNHIVWNCGDAVDWLILENNSIRRQQRRTDKMLNYTFNFRLAKMVIPLV